MWLGPKKNTDTADQFKYSFQKFFFPSISSALLDRQAMGNQMNVPMAYDMGMPPADVLSRMPPTPTSRVPAPVVTAAAAASTSADEPDAAAMAEAQSEAEAAAVRAKYQQVWAAFQSLDWKAEDDVLRSDLTYSKMSPHVWMKERKHASAMAQQRMQSALAATVTDATASSARATGGAEPSAPQPISLALVLGLIKHFKKNRLLSPMMVVRILMQARYDPMCVLLNAC
jgi:hypothetical protein